MHSLQCFDMASSIDILTPFNFHQWRGDMEIQLSSRGLYWVTVETEEEPTHVIEKAKRFNKKYEAFGFLCLSISKDLLFQLSGLKNPKEIWDQIASLYGK